MKNATITLHSYGIKNPIAQFNPTQWGTALDVARRSALETGQQHSVLHVAPDGLRTMIYFMPHATVEGKVLYVTTGAYQTREEGDDDA